VLHVAGGCSGSDQLIVRHVDNEVGTQPIAVEERDVGGRSFSESPGSSDPSNHSMCLVHGGTEAISGRHHVLESCSRLKEVSKSSLAESVDVIIESETVEPGGNTDTGSKHCGHRRCPGSQSQIRGAVDDN
jgi:hypothetical protein